MVFISAGFDAHAADPLADLRLAGIDYAWVTEQACLVANRHAEGRIVSTLEGGYDLQGLAASVGIHVQALMRGNADQLDHTDDSDAYEDDD